MSLVNCLKIFVVWVQTSDFMSKNVARGTEMAKSFQENWLLLKPSPLKEAHLSTYKLLGAEEIGLLLDDSY